MKIAIPSVAFNREQLDAFQRLFEAILFVFEANEIEKFT